MLPTINGEHPGKAKGGRGMRQVKPPHTPFVNCLWEFRRESQTYPRKSCARPSFYLVNPRSCFLVSLETRSLCERSDTIFSISFLAPC
jgi:hypothetical protein